MRNFFDDEETKVNDELFDNTPRGTVSEESFENKSQSQGRVSLNKQSKESVDKNSTTIVDVEREEVKAVNEDDFVAPMEENSFQTDLPSVGADIV